MLSRKIRIPLGLFLVFILTTCDTSTLEPDERLLGFPFFPVEVGHFIEYEVEDIAYALSTPPSRNVYRLREEITERFEDSQGRESYRLERFRRTDASKPWVPIPDSSVWVIRRNNFQAIQVENNQAFVKLTFPVSEGQTWDGNALNGLEMEEYRVEDVAFPLALDNSPSFGSTVRVVHKEECSLVALDRRTEVFADSIGLIYKEIWQVNFDPQGTCLDSTGVFCDDEIPLTIPQKPLEACIQFGRIYTQKLISYGKN